MKRYRQFIRSRSRKEFIGIILTGFLALVMAVLLTRLV